MPPIGKVRVVSYDRDADPVEFGRLVGLTDNVFAVALTLLVLDLGLPARAANVPLGTALADHAPSFSAFIISVAVVGTFFLSHHELVNMLQRVDDGLLALTIPYLGMIALIPFAQSLLIERSTETLAFALYGLLLGVTSILGAAQLWHAQRRGLLRERLTGRNAWFEVARSALPVVLFLSSAALAPMIGGWAVLFWVAIWPSDSVLVRLQRRTG